MLITIGFNKSQMTMTDQRGAAEYLRDHPLLNEIFDGLEKDATERAIHAKPDDDETRRDALHQVRAIRNVRRELERKASPANPKPRGAVA